MLPHTLVIVEHNRHFLHFVAQLIRDHYSDLFVLLGSAENDEAALALTTKLHPQVILLNLGGPGLSGLALLPAIRQTVPCSIVIGMSAQQDSAYPYAALAAGVDAWIAKDELNTHDRQPACVAQRRDQSPRDRGPAAAGGNRKPASARACRG